MTRIKDERKTYEIQRSKYTLDQTYYLNL